MPVEIEITNADIAFAENILFLTGEKFDSERIAFIKNLDTIDLQAVPGSGKTTALMAKLLILERYLPFDDGSGILVISHTNAAIDEIKSKIGKYCPKLFSYPNFIGTIQSFVDKFLAIPYYILCYKKKPYRIDGDIYNEKAINFFLSLHPSSALKTWIVNNNVSAESFQELRFDSSLNIVNGINGETKLYASKKNAYKELKNFKKQTLEDGYLHFDDAYFLANRFIAKTPQIVKLLQARFCFVFVDEMQDMEEHQHNLLEKIFFDGGNSASIYQRIGDKNQSIYSHKVSLEEVWSQRETLTITGSHRLTRPIAELVDCFALHRDSGFEVKGLQNGDILPHLIVYDDKNIQNVIPKYSEIINHLRIEEKKIPLSENVFKAIGWRKNHDDKDKIGIGNYFHEFDMLTHDSRTEHSYLGHYLINNRKSNNSLTLIHANIISAFLKILRLENIESEQGRKYSKHSLFSYLKENDEPFFDEFILNIFKWSMAIAHGKDIINIVRANIPGFLAHFGSSINNSKEFINTEFQEDKDEFERNKMRNLNSVNYNGFDIDITTIHAEKGKTHTATLYMETYYYSDGSGEKAKSYESQRLCEQIKGNQLLGNEKIRVKESAKMMYVGISRPTHLLCIAVHKERFEKHLSDINMSKWVIKRIDKE